MLTSTEDNQRSEMFFLRSIGKTLSTTPFLKEAEEQPIDEPDVSKIYGQYVFFDTIPYNRPTSLKELEKIFQTLKRHENMLFKFMKMPEKWTCRFAIFYSASPLIFKNNRYDVKLTEKIAENLSKIANVTYDRISFSRIRFELSYNDPSSKRDKIIECLGKIDISYKYTKLPGKKLEIYFNPYISVQHTADALLNIDNYEEPEDEEDSSDGEDISTLEKHRNKFERDSEDNFMELAKEIATKNKLEFSEDTCRRINITTKKTVDDLRTIFRVLKKDPVIYFDIMELPEKWAGGPNQKGLFFASNFKLLKAEMSFVKTSIKLMEHFEVLLGEIRGYGSNCFIVETQDREKIRKVMSSVDLKYSIFNVGGNGTQLEYCSMTSHDRSERKAAKLVENMKKVAADRFVIKLKKEIEPTKAYALVRIKDCKNQNYSIVGVFQTKEALVKYAGCDPEADADADAAEEYDVREVDCFF